MNLEAPSAFLFRIYLTSTLLLGGIFCQGIADEVRQPPNIITPVSSDDLYFTSGAPVSVNCSAQGSPKPTYTWKQNGAFVTPSDYVNFNQVTGTLTFSSFAIRDEATYMCVATNRFSKEDGSSYNVSSWSGRLKIWQAGVSFIKNSPIVRTPTAYDPIMLSCDPTRAKGEVLIKNWYNEKGESIFVDGDRLYVDNDGKLYFSYVLPTDSTPDGYSCGITATDEKSIQLGQTYKLTVGQRTPTAIRPQLFYSNNGVKALRFGSARLECVFSGYDPTPPNSPVITWLDDAGNPVTSTPDGKYTITNNGHSLTITNLQETDEKQYTCNARNTAGTATSTVLLDVTSAPIFINGAPSDKTVPQGRDVTFSCECRSASGEPNPSAPIWYMNGNRVSGLDPAKYVFSSGNSALTVRSVTKANDIMCIQCEVTNSVDTVMGNACLNVIDPITITNENDLVLNPSIVYGDMVKMTVVAITDPLLTLSYRWEFQNKSYQGADAPPHMTYNPSTNEAYIDTSKLTEDEYGGIGGIYTRVVYHQYDERRVPFDVYLRDRAAYETNVTASDNETTTNSPVDNATEISDGTFRNDFRCGETAIEVFIPAYLVPNSQLTLRDESCKLVNNGTHHVISFPYNQCGTSEIFYSQQILITNEIKVQSTLKYVDSGPVKFVTDYTIPLNCFPGGNQTVSSVLQILAPEKFQEGVLPNARFEIREYKSANYQEQITAYPVKVPLNREIYFELALTNARPNTSSSIQVSKCQATPSDNPNDRTNYLLVSNGCSASPAVQILARPTPDLFRFSSQAFQFSNANDLIYVHCYVSVCSSGQCTLPCGRPGRGRRSLRGRLQSDLVTLTSSGFQVVTE